MVPKWRPYELRSPQPFRLDPEPAYLLLRSAEEMSQAFGVTAWASPVDFGREAVIAVRRGECPTGGYGVAIKKLTREDTAKRPGASGGAALRVEVALTDPAPSAFVTMVITYPQAAVAIDRRSLEGVSRLVFTGEKGEVLGSLVLAR